jgi:small subunit ribosomal protein S18
LADEYYRNDGDDSRGGERGERRGRGRSGPGGARKFIRKPKVCAFCVEKKARIDYKQIDVVRRYVTERGKIRPRRQTGMCAKHQRLLSHQVKRARHLALLPYSASPTR